MSVSVIASALASQFGIAGMARRVQNSGRSGWYCRVFQAGCAEAGQAFVLVERPLPDWSLARIGQARYPRRAEPELLPQLLELPRVPSWRVWFERRLALGMVENGDSRAQGRSSRGRGH